MKDYNAIIVKNEKIAEIADRLNNLIEGEDK